MLITVRLFAMLKDKAGASEMKLELPEGATVANVIEAIKERAPAIGEHARAAAFAVNKEYAQAGTILKNGDEVAVIPPVSGG